MGTISDNMKEDLFHPHLVSALESKLDEEALTPEVIAWADSCLFDDVDASTADWSSIKDTLLDILSSQQSDPTDDSSASHSSMEVTTTDEIPGPHENLTSVEFKGGYDKDEDFIDEGSGEGESTATSEDDEDDHHMLGNKRIRRRRRRSVISNVFRPNYSEDVKVQESDFDNLSPIGPEEDGFVEDIFKVWDLGISIEQDDFTKLLDKALDNVPPQSQSSDSTAFKDMIHVSIDDLIAGVGDLSLKQNTD